MAQRTNVTPLWQQLKSHFVFVMRFIFKCIMRFIIRSYMVWSFRAFSHVVVLQASREILIYIHHDATRNHKTNTDWRPNSLDIFRAGSDSVHSLRLYPNAGRTLPWIHQETKALKAVVSASSPRREVVLNQVEKLTFIFSFAVVLEPFFLHLMPHLSILNARRLSLLLVALFSFSFISRFLSPFVSPFVLFPSHLH